mgnify:CR=1 FL=1
MSIDLALSIVVATLLGWMALQVGALRPDLLAGLLPIGPVARFDLRHDIVVRRPVVLLRPRPVAEKGREDRAVHAAVHLNNMYAGCTRNSFFDGHFRHFKLIQKISQIHN